MSTKKLQILTPIVTSVNGETGDVTVATKTSELTNDSGFATTTYVDTSVAGLVDSAPETLDTLNELSAALGNDPNFATTVANQIGTKVDKVNGKGLSTNDYTTAEKNKLSGIATGANKTTVDSALSTTSTNPVQNKVINTALSGKANSTHTHKASDITSGAFGLAQGGTGANSASGARTNLGAFSTGGGTLTGNVTISADNPWIKLLNNGNSGFLQMYSSGTKMAVGFGSTKSLILDSDGCLILTAAMYGTTLPAAGKKGRIFFKKV